MLKVCVPTCAFTMSGKILFIIFKYWNLDMHVRSLYHRARAHRPLIIKIASRKFSFRSHMLSLSRLRMCPIVHTCGGGLEPHGYRRGPRAAARREAVRARGPLAAPHWTTSGGRGLRLWTLWKLSVAEGMCDIHSSLKYSSII